MHSLHNIEINIHQRRPKLQPKITNYSLPIFLEFQYTIEFRENPNNTQHVTHTISQPNPI